MLYEKIDKINGMSEEIIDGFNKMNDDIDIINDKLDSMNYLLENASKLEKEMLEWRLSTTLKSSQLINS